MCLLGSHSFPYQSVLLHLIIYLGIPIPIVAITAGMAHEQYGHDNL